MLKESCSNCKFLNEDKSCDFHTIMKARPQHVLEWAWCTEYEVKKEDN